MIKNNMEKGVRRSPLMTLAIRKGLGYESARVILSVKWRNTFREYFKGAK